MLALLMLVMLQVPSYPLDGTVWPVPPHDQHLQQLYYPRWLMKLPGAMVYCADCDAAGDRHGDGNIMLHVQRDKAIKWIPLSQATLDDIKANRAWYEKVKAYWRERHLIYE